MANKEQEINNEILKYQKLLKEYEDIMEKVQSIGSNQITSIKKNVELLYDEYKKNYSGNDDSRKDIQSIQEYINTSQNNTKILINKTLSTKTYYESKITELNKVLANIKSI